MRLSPVVSQRRAGRPLEAARGQSSLADRRRRTLEILAAALALAGLADARLMGAALDWAAVGEHLLPAGMAMLLFRELALIRWAARAGAPHPTYRDPWGRPLPWEVADGDD